LDLLVGRHAPLERAILALAIGDPRFHLRRKAAGIQRIGGIFACPLQWSQFAEFSYAKWSGGNGDADVSGGIRGQRKRLERRSSVSHGAKVELVGRMLWCIEDRSGTCSVGRC